MTVLILGRVCLYKNGVLDYDRLLLGQYLPNMATLIGLMVTMFLSNNK